MLPLVHYYTISSSYGVRLVDEDCIDCLIESGSKEKGGTNSEIRKKKSGKSGESDMAKRA